MSDLASRSSSEYVPKLLHEIFLDYLRDEELESAMDLIEEEDFDIHQIFHIYDFEFNAFQVVCFEIYLKLESKSAPINDFVECAKLLLDSGIDIKYCDPDYKFQAIQFAVMTGQTDLVEYTIERYKQDEISITNYNLITQLISFSIDEGGISQEYLQMIVYLINRNVNINKFDLDTGEPPIYMAARMKYKSVIKVLIDMKPFMIDLDFYVDDNGKTARNIIEKYHLYDGILPKLHSLTDYNIYSSMYDVIQFIKEYKEDKPDMDNDYIIILMFRAIDHGLHEVFRVLLEDVPKETLNMHLILRTVCKRGCYKILRILLKYPRIAYDESLIEEIVDSKRIENDIGRYRSSNRCLQLLLEKKSLNLNKLNKNNHCLLEIAIQHRYYDMVMTLLNKGASFIKVNNDTIECLINFLPPEMVKDFLDSCIVRISQTFQYGKLHETESLDTTVSTIDYRIDYRSFLIPRQEQFLSSSTIKKSRIKKRNDKLFEFTQELMGFVMLSKDPKYVHILIHPFTIIFIYMKWLKVRWFFYTDLILYVIYALLANIYIYATQNFVCLGFFIAIIIIAETWQLLQIIIHGWNQLYVFENWYKFLLFVLSVTVITHVFMTKNYSCTWLCRNIELQACLSLVSITNIFFASGCLPYFSTSVIMIKSIYGIIFKSFIHYTFLLLAFATTFHVLFKHSPDSLFKNYIKALVKTVLMASGEYDTYNIGLWPFPDISNIVLVFFVVLISLGLLNFLTGLSVSDINKVKRNAEIFGQIMRIENMARIEELLYKGKRKGKFFFLAKYICLFPLSAYNTVVEVDTKNRHLHYFKPKHTILSIPKKIARTLKVYSHSI